MKMKNEKIKKKTTAHNFFLIKNANFDRPLQNPIGTDQDKTSSLKVSYNKGISYCSNNLVRQSIGKYWP